jgi:hypothetical protein
MKGNLNTLTAYNYAGVGQLTHFCLSIWSSKHPAPVLTEQNNAKQHKGKIKLKAKNHIKKIHTDHCLPALLSILTKRQRMGKSYSPQHGSITE